MEKLYGTSELMKSTLIAAATFLILSSAHATIRLDHPYGSIYVPESSVCIKNNAFQLKEETYQYCHEDVFSRKTGRCTNVEPVIPTRKIQSIEVVCIKKNPAKNSSFPCLKTGERIVELSTTYEIVETTGNYKHPGTKIVREFQIPACSY